MMKDGMQWENSNDNANQVDDEEWEGGNNCSKLFERSRIKALAGMSHFSEYACQYDK